MTADKAQIKKLLYSLGKLLGFLGLAFVFYKLYKTYTWESFVAQFSLINHTLGILLLINIFSSLIGIYAWHIILLHYAKKTFPFLDSYYYFARTEISKYLPGNIFHFVGRQMLASEIGISQKEMAKTSLLFSLLLLAATVLSSTLFAFFASDVPWYILTFMLLSSMITIVATRYLYPSLPLKKKALLVALLSFSVALQGIMIGIIIAAQSSTMTAGLFFACVSIYIISWLIGFVTPGASGGLGVREGSFIAIASFLHIDIASQVIIFSVLLVRLINILVDILMYLSTFVINKKMARD